MKIFLHRVKPLEKVIALILLIFFIYPSFVGAREPMLCIDQEETHSLVQDRFSPRACHANTAAFEVVKDFYSDISVACKKNPIRSCIDISSNPCNASFTSRIIEKLQLRTLLGMLLFEQYLPLLQGPNQAPLKFNTQPYLFNSSLTSLQTVVLLI